MGVGIWLTGLLFLQIQPLSSFVFVSEPSLCCHVDTGRVQEGSCENECGSSVSTLSWAVKSRMWTGSRSDSRRYQIPKYCLSREAYSLWHLLLNTCMCMHSLHVNKSILLALGCHKKSVNPPSLWLIIYCVYLWVCLLHEEVKLYSRFMSWLLFWSTFKANSL